jgi:hypothetical protein
VKCLHAVSFYRVLFFSAIILSVIIVANIRTKLECTGKLTSMVLKYSLKAYFYTCKLQLWIKSCFHWQSLAQQCKQTHLPYLLWPISCASISIFLKVTVTVTVTRNSHYCTCLGWHDTDRIISIYVVLPKVAKASTVVTVACCCGWWFC